MKKITLYLNNSSTTLARIMTGIIMALAIIGVSAAMISMLSGRPIGDDYGAIYTHHQKGSWLEEAMISLSTTGRYGQSIASSFLYGILGDNTPSILPILLLIWLLLVIYLYSKLIIKKYTNNSAPSSLISLCVSIVLSFLVLFINNAPESSTPPVWISYQLFFWPSGIVTYTLPLLGLLTSVYAFWLAPFAKRIPKKIRIALLSLSVLLTSLFNEIQPATLVSLAAICLVLSYTKPYSAIKKYRSHLYTGASLAVAGLALSFFSPGRINRSESISSSSQGSLSESVIRNIGMLINDHWLRPRELALIVLIGFVAAVLANRFIRSTPKYKVASLVSSKVSFLLITLLVSATIVSLVLIGIGYGPDAGIYPRTLLIPQALYVITIPTITFAIVLTALRSKQFYIPKLILPASLLVVSLGVVISIPNYLSKINMQVQSSVLYAYNWDVQDESLKEAAKNHTEGILYVKNPVTGLGDGFTITCTGPYVGSTIWLNYQIQQYYGISAEKVCKDPDNL